MPSLETSTPTLSQARDFLAVHGATPDASEAAAIISVPLLTRLDGKGPNYPVLGSDQDPELENVVANKRLHSAALAVVSVGRSGLVTVEMVLTPDSKINSGQKIAGHPVEYFGRPVGGRSDFGKQIQDRQGGERFTGFVANIGFGSELAGIDAYSGKPTIIGGTSFDRTDADRMARPTLVFGAKYGKTVPMEQVQDHKVTPTLQG